MIAGDTICQQVFIPSFYNFSLKLIFGVRIKEIINETNRIGFSYETLNGHVEIGISTFTFEKFDDKIFFKIHTFSKSGNLLVRLLEILISKPHQRYCTQKALLNVKNNMK